MIKLKTQANMNISAAHIKWKMLQIMANASTTIHIEILEMHAAR